MESEILELLKGIGIDDAILEEPPNSEFGDIALPCFSFAKVEKKSPNEVANDIHNKIEKHLPKGVIDRSEVNGGYVNFFIDWSKASSRIVNRILKEGNDYGKSTDIDKQKIMVEYSQPNPAKAMHIGHARGTFLGDALCNIFEFLGHNVIRANYMNDCGLQVAKLVTAINLWANDEKPKGKKDKWLWKYYVKYHEEAEKDPSIEDKAREMLRLIDVEKDKEMIELRDKIVNWCIEGFEETYEKVGVDFDMYLHESDFREKGKEIVNKAMDKKINGKPLAFESDEGTIVADLEDYGLPGLVILRSDGTGLYQTSDLGMTVYKFEHYNVDKAIWVVASAQELYFKQIKKMLGLLGYNWVENAIHFSFDLVRLSEGKMSSRKGIAVLLDEVVDKLTEMALKEINKRTPDDSEEDKMKIAKSIGVGALKYSIEKVEPNKGITFDFEKMLNFEGNTGPYLQYAHTRCSSILEKVDDIEDMPEIVDLDDKEIELLKILLKFPKTVKQSADEMRINDICNYAFELATCFNTFYNSCPVITADTADKRKFRILLVNAVKITLKNSLQILGIDALEKM